MKTTYPIPATCPGCGARIDAADLLDDCHGEAEIDCPCGRLLTVERVVTEVFAVTAVAWSAARRAQLRAEARHGGHICRPGCACFAKRCDGRGTCCPTWTDSDHDDAAPETTP